MLKDKIQGLETKRAAKLSELEALATKAADEDRDLTDAEQQAYKDIKGEITTIDETLKRHREVEQIRASAAVVLDTAIGTPPGAGGGGGGNIVVANDPAFEAQFAQTMKSLSLFFGGGYHEKPTKSSKSDFGVFVVSLLATKGNPMMAAGHAWNKFGNDAVAKALATTPNADGGILVPTQFSSEFIELLRPASVIRKAGPRIMNFPGGFGSIQLPRAATGVTAGWVGENQPIGYGQMTFEPVTLTPKKLAAITAISNELIRRSMPDVDVIVRDDLVQSVAVVESATMINSLSATATHPIGLKGIATNAGHTAPSGGTTLVLVTADVDGAALILKNLNVQFTNPAWFMSPRSETYLMSIRDGLGNYAFRAELLLGRFNRWPVFTTTSIPDNDNVEESTILLVDMADMVLGQELAVVVDVSAEASYSTTGASADMVSSFQSDQTVVRVIETVDFAARRPSVAMITGVEYGTSS